ncbi:MAG TPA: uroporphyrinogen decarboxylase family protein [Candidatus Brocadiia bacterium]|nr:uroporphyrinogen decarboxylase family protein [Candidatus Brocadiia bacterium]
MPCYLSLSMSAWDSLREELEEVVLRHPVLFPGYQKGKHDFANLRFAPDRVKGSRFRDTWGCVWEANVNGMMGVVVEHPLDDWGKMSEWQAPDALTTGEKGPVDWEAIRAKFGRKLGLGALRRGATTHGFFLLRLSYLRGFENLMLDLATEAPELAELIRVVDHYNSVWVRQYLDIGIDVMEFAEDLGTQTSSIISPAMFRKWVMPSYKLLMKPCREQGALVYLHSDGYILDLMDCLEECGVDIVNPQDLVNGIDNIARVCKGRFSVRLDVDRQRIVPFGTRQEIRELIEEEVRKLGSRRGGLELVCGIYPPTPPENVDAVCCAMEEFRTYWFDGRGKESL